MIRHVVMFKWKPDFSEAQQQAWADSVKGLPEKIDTIRSLVMGHDILHGPRSYDVVLMTDFDTLDDVKAYASHPDHLPIIAVSQPNAESMITVDYEL